jgi:hypothetical protein
MRADRVDSAARVLLNFSNTGKNVGWYFREVSGFSRVKDGLGFKKNEVFMPKTHLKREPGSDSDDPKWSDVQAMMQNILVDTFSPVRRDEPVANMDRLLRNYSSRLGGFTVSVNS